MLNLYKKAALILSCALLFVACSTKEKLYNLSPQQWYEMILKELDKREFDKAKQYYISFSSEHINSPLLESILLTLSSVCEKEGNYEEANAYLDQYIARFGTYEKIEYARYLKIRVNYNSFVRPNRNQGLMKESIATIESFLNDYPNSIYKPQIQTMLVKFRLALLYLNRDILSLYERTSRDESAKIYRQLIEQDELNKVDMIPPKLPFYRKIFE